MQDIMLDIVNHYGYLGVFLLILIENIFPPIPSEVLLLFGGALTVATKMNIPGVIIASTAGSLIGAIVLYALGRILQVQRLKKLFAGRFGRILHLKPQHVDKSVSWFEKYQGKAVFICRCVPLVRSLISIPAGFANMHIPRFLLFTALGSAIWNTLLVCAGAALGSSWENAIAYIDKYTYILVAVIVILFLLLVIRTILKKRKKQK